jgi:hypothetical protein
VTPKRRTSPDPRPLTSDLLHGGEAQRLPEGMVCGDCDRYQTCAGIGCTHVTATVCDWLPSRFEEKPLLPHEPPSLDPDQAGVPWIELVRICAACMGTCFAGRTRGGYGYVACRACNGSGRTRQCVTIEELAELLRPILAQPATMEDK